jgi:hypothetical protein
VIISAFIGITMCVGLFAMDNPCLQYKIIPSLQIKEQSINISVVRTSLPLDYTHGNVVANFIQEYDIEFDVKSIEGGYCVFIKSVSAKFGYNNFDIQIDSKYSEDSCEYKEILRHENLHINAYLSVINDNTENIRSSIAASLAMVLPIYAKSNTEVSDAVYKLRGYFESNPKMKLLISTIEAEQEIRSRQVDRTDRPGAADALLNCAQI